MNPQRANPVVLEGRRVRLVPLALDHVESLAEVGLDPEIWRWSPHPVSLPEDMKAYVEVALEEQKRGVSLPFAITISGTGQVVGSTRFGAMDLGNRRVEIGWTWIAPLWQRSFVNTEAKFLMLEFAFESLGCHRVELKTDALNAASRRAIARLGAKPEGTFRKHMVTASGRQRDSVFFSIVDDEWPAIKASLSAKIQAS